MAEKRKNPYGIYPYFMVRGSTAAQPNVRASFEVGSYSWNEIGGPRAASIKATGDEAAMAELFALIGCGVELRDRNGEPRWWGMVTGVTAGTEGASVDDMANSISVIYTTQDTNGASTKAQTAWVSDSDGVAEYGTKQLIKTASSATDASATAMATAALAVKKYPVVKTEFSGRPGNVATLSCRGWFDILKWKYYSEPAIGVKNWPSRSETALSDAQTTSYIAEPENQTFQFGDVTASQYLRFGFTMPGTRPMVLKTLRVKGAKIGTPTDDLTVSVYSDSAGAPNVLMGSVTLENGDLTTSHAWIDISMTQETTKIWILPNTMYHVRIQRNGALDASNYYRLASNNAVGYTGGASYLWNGSAWVSTNASSGNPPVTGDILFEMRADTSEASYDLGGTTSHQRIAVPFTLGGTQDAAIATMTATLSTVGTPLGDVVGYLCSDSSGSPGSVIDYIAVDCATLSSTPAKKVFTLTLNTLNSYLSTLWFQLYPTYGYNAADYVRVSLDSTNAYGATGTTKIYNGSAWSAISPTESMWFEVTGIQQTTVQMQNVITDFNQTAFISGIELELSSAVFSSPYRDGTGTCNAVISDLLKAGTSAGAALLATVTREKKLRIYQDPGSSASGDYYIDRNNDLSTALGIAVDNSICPVGVYVRRRNSIAALSANSLLLNASSYPIADAEYDVQNDNLKLVARGARDPFDLSLKEG